MAHENHDTGQYARGRSAGLAAFIGLFLGGIAFFYAFPVRKAIFWSFISYALVIASLGVLILPVFAGCALAAAWAVQLSDGHFALGGEDNAVAAYPSGHQRVDPTPPGIYQSVHGLMPR